MEITETQPATLIFISLFVVGYITFLLLKIRQDRVDLIDFILLSAVSLIPAFFAFFPTFVQFLSLAIGVKFPFVVLFAVLIMVSYLQMHRSAIAVYKLKMKLIQLSQQQASLELEVKNLTKALRQNERKSAD